MIFFLNHLKIRGLIVIIYRCLREMISICWLRINGLRVIFDWFIEQLIAVRVFSFLDTVLWCSEKRTILITLKNTLNLADSKSCSLRIFSGIKYSPVWAIISHLWWTYRRLLLIKDGLFASPPFTAGDRWNKQALFACVLLWVITYLRLQIELYMPLRHLRCPLWMWVLQIIFNLLLISPLLHLLMIQYQRILVTVDFARTFRGCACGLALRCRLGLNLRSNLMLFIGND